MSLQICLSVPFSQAYTFLSFIVGMGPPSYIFNLIGAGHTLLNLLKVFMQPVLTIFCLSSC